MFDDFFAPEPALRKRANTPAVNVKETDKGYDIQVAAPGYNKDDFDISVDNNMLTIKAEIEEKQEDEKLSRKEFHYASFQRTFTLPDNVNDEKIEAQYKDGILHINVPVASKKEVEQKKTIKIK
jgi:HSP20 family protein